MYYPQTNNMETYLIICRNIILNKWKVCHIVKMYINNSALTTLIIIINFIAQLIPHIYYLEFFNLVFCSENQAEK